MMIWYDHAWSWWGWLLMTAGMLAFWGLLIWAVITAARGGIRDRDTTTARPAPSPQQILAERFARGEIDEHEYHQRLDALHATSAGAAPR